MEDHMRTVVRNSFARQTILSERVPVSSLSGGCTECGGQRGPEDRPWLYRFVVEDDQGARHSGPIANGRLFCSRACAEMYLGQSFDECRQ
jgi:hypothetical protein